MLYQKNLGYNKSVQGETCRAIITCHGDEFCAFSFLHGDVLDGAYACTCSASDAFVWVGGWLKHLYHLLSERCVHRNPAQQTPSAIVDSASVVLDVVDNAF